ADEEVSEDRSGYEHDGLRAEREDERVAQRLLEVRIGPGVGEVVESDEVAVERASEGVGQAEVDSPAERHADDERHEHHGGGDEERCEDATVLEDTPPTTCAGTPAGSGLRVHPTAPEA